MGKHECLTCKDTGVYVWYETTTGAVDQHGEWIPVGHRGERACVCTLTEEVVE